MAKRILSHILIALAVASLISTYFIWVVDATVFNPTKLTEELRKSGVSSELANVLVERTVQKMPPEEAEVNRPKVAQVITPVYIERKLNELAKALTTFMKEGSPQPTLDLTDFPGQVGNAGITLTLEESAEFDKPIELNKQEKLNWLPRAYKILGKAKYVGVLLFIVLLTIELFVSPTGQKLKRTGRIFLHTSVWFFTLWAMLIYVPSKLAERASDSIKDQGLQELVDSVLQTISSLFSIQFLGFAIVTAVIAITMYVLRHTFKHLEKIKEVPTGRIKSRTQVKLPR